MELITISRCKTRKPRLLVNPMVRFLKYIKILENGCWIWIGSKNEDGYGEFWYQGKIVKVHRFSYEYFKGEISEGMEIDHKCHNLDLSCKGGVTCQHRLCINPDHLEPVKHIVNSHRGRNGIKTHCIHGHLLSPDNIYIDPNSLSRYCQTCRLERAKKSYYKYREIESGLKV